MAASLSRPDPSSPASVAEAGFSTTRRGFNQDEVRAFLTSVAAELSRVQERERQLGARVEAAEAANSEAPELDEETVAAMLGEETLRVLQTARESASQIKIRAEESAAKILNDANDEANRLRQDAEVEAARKRHDAASDAEAEVALAKQQGREMVNEARAYRERVLADLERRTKLARQQIEDLVNGRDRLLQVFERARLVAVDVTSELQSIDGPAEFVNFSPTTGPLPLMVPASDLDDSADTSGVSEPSDHAVDAIDEGLEPISGPDDTDVETQAENDADTDADTDTDAEADSELVVDTGDDDTESLGETDGAADIDGTAESSDDVDETGDDADEVVDEADAQPATRDANVVSLFRGRGGEQPAAVDRSDGADDDEDPAASEDAATEVDEAAERPDVGDIFERLRSESPTDTDDGPVADEHAAAEDGSAADVDADEQAATEVDEAEAVTDDGPDAEAEESEPTPFSRRDEALVPLIVGGARKLKRVLADEQNGVLDQLRQKQPITQLDELIADLGEHVATYTDALADELLEAAVSGAAEVGKNDTKTLRTTIVKGGALERSHAVVREDLVVPLRGRLERAIADGDGDNDDITKRVRAVYREWKTQHIDDQLDDAFRFAHGGGLAAGVKPGTAMNWIIDPSEPTCPDCEDNSLAGEVAAGDAYPTGHVAAPAHPGCRCLTVPAGQ